MNLDEFKIICQEKPLKEASKFLKEVLPIFKKEAGLYFKNLLEKEKNFPTGPGSELGQIKKTIDNSKPNEDEYLEYWSTPYWSAKTFLHEKKNKIEFRLTVAGETRSFYFPVGFKDTDIPENHSITVESLLKKKMMKEMN